MQITKTKLHPRNKHNSNYNFEELIKSCPELQEHVIVNKYDTQTINFSDATAVKLLNKALLLHFYELTYWDIPKQYLCPPIPGRADYIHYISDLIEKNEEVTCLDIGIGANCIYPIIGINEYNWKFIATDIDPDALVTAETIISNNKSLKGKIDLRFQPNKKHIFKGIINENDKIDVVICNPPFHASAEEAFQANVRKTSNLKKKKVFVANQNFGGIANELWIEGGEKEFVKNMIRESIEVKDSVKWFTSLVSKEANLIPLYKTLKKFQPKEVKTINMAQGIK